MLEKQEKARPLRDEKGRLLPGQTANPYGRPKKYTIHDYITPEQVEEIIKIAKDKAEQGDINMIKMIVEHVFGKPRQSIEHTGEDGEAIKVKHEFSSEYAKKFNTWLKQDGV